MEIEVVDILRVDLIARHVHTKAEIFLPQVHILLEKVGDTFIATCPEYLQSCDAKSVEQAVDTLISIIFKYFFEMIKKHGKESIYTSVKETHAEPLWSKIREYKARKHDDFLTFIEESFKNNESLADLANKLPKENPSTPKRNRELEEKDAIIKNLSDALRKMKIERDTARADLRRHTSGLEGAVEFEEDIANISFASV